MPYVFIRQKVEDYPKWKAGFDNDVDARQTGGSTGAQVFRDADNSNVVSILSIVSQIHNTKNAAFFRKEGGKVQKKDENW